MFCETIKKPCPFKEEERLTCELCPLKRAWVNLGLEFGTEHLLLKDKYPVIISGGVVGNLKNIIGG